MGGHNRGKLHEDVPVPIPMRMERDHFQYKEIPILSARGGICGVYALQFWGDIKKSVFVILLKNYPVFWIL